MQETKEDNFDTLLLSGGGVKGFCILGAVQALMDKKLLTNIKTFIGTSIGSIISYFLAIGYTPVEIMVALHVNDWLDNMKFFDIVKMYNGFGACSFAPMQEALEKLTIQKIGKFLTLGKLYEEFGKKLICVTYNTTKCMTEYIGPDNYPDVPCLIALRMSCNIPLVFERFSYMENFYIDGGISDNFAIAKAQSVGKKIIGIYLDISENSLKDDPSKGIVTYFLKLLYIPLIQSTKKIISLIGNDSKIISIKTDDIKNAIEFDVSTRERLDMFSVGYNTVKDAESPASLDEKKEEPMLELIKELSDQNTPTA